MTAKQRSCFPTLAKLGWGTHSFVVGWVAKNKCRSFDFHRPRRRRWSLRMTARMEIDAIHPSPEKAKDGATILLWRVGVAKDRSRSFDFHRCAPVAQDDGAVGSGPRGARPACLWMTAEWGFVLSHPSRKNNGPARMGHPYVFGGGVAKNKCGSPFNFDRSRDLRSG